MAKVTAQEIRQTLLEIIAAAQPRTPSEGNLQQNTVFIEVKQRLNVRNDVELEQLVLSEWFSLFNTGYLSWGHDLSNSSPPFCHVTARGKTMLEALSRDPGNPAGYLAYLQSLAPLNPVAASYLSEGLDCYVAGHFKAAAVMLGGASESIVLELRDLLLARMEELCEAIPSKLQDWRVKTVLDALQVFVDSRKKAMPRELWEEYCAYWSAFTQQIRAVRNDAGHPSSVDPISPESAHASFLIFPLLSQLATRLRDWVSTLPAS